MAEASERKAEEPKPKKRSKPTKVSIPVAQELLDKYAGDPGRYVLEKSVGRGAYGNVYLAQSRKTGNRVAVKHICDAFHNSMDSRRIYREMRVMAHFHHPNLVNLIEVIPPADPENFQDIYLVVELMETDLHRVITSRQDLTSDHIAYFLYQMLCGLKHLHSADVVHRDLKPSNLLVNANCNLKVCDFGLARETELYSHANFTEYVVTRWYRAPEVLLSGGRYTSAIDMWSVGCILGELLLRQPLFPGEDYLHQLKLITNIIGTPSDEDLHYVKSQPARDFMLRPPHCTRKDFNKLFPHAANTPCLDLLDKILVFDPEKRITVEEAIAHPFFARVRRGSGDRGRSMERTCGKPFRMGVRLNKLSVVSLLSHEEAG